MSTGYTRYIIERSLWSIPKWMDNRKCLQISETTQLALQCGFSSGLWSPCCTTHGFCVTCVPIALLVTIRDWRKIYKAQETIGIRKTQPRGLQMDDVEDRAEILLEEANQLLNRLENDISYLGGKIASFFGITVSVMSFQATLIIVLSSIKGFTKYSYLFLILYLAFMLWSAGSLFYLLRPRSLKDVDVFREDRLERLRSCSKKVLLSDLMYFTKKVYENNYKTYKKCFERLKDLYSLFLMGNVFYVFLIISLWITTWERWLNGQR